MRASALWTAAVATTLAIAAILLRLAWVGDDAYITLRTVEHVVSGHGAVWNLGERVQTYTHPLWMLLLCFARLVTGESYFGTIWLSLALAMAASLMLLRLGRNLPAAIAIGSLLLWSRSYTEYAVCGLENPLSFVLLAALVAVVTGEDRPARRTSMVALLTGLAAVTRMDLMVIFAPALLANVRAIGVRPWLWRTVLGGLPLALWLAFAIVYYGTPLPVTAYAKAISHGLPASEMAQQGLHHFVFMGLYDPLTLVVITAGIVVGLLRPTLRSRTLALGALLYCGYIVKVGGDFMAGRFFTLPFVVSVAILGRALAGARPRHGIAVALVAAAVAFVPGAPAWFHSPANDREPTWHHHGILDERSAYYRELGLFSPRRKIPQPGAGTAGVRALGRQRPLIASAGKAGVYAFEGGDLLHFFDPLLCDPLLARLPKGDSAEWRIGHIAREVPEGYLESLAFGDNRIRDPGLRRYYGALHTANTAPLFAARRWQALWGLWTGAFAADLRAYVAGPYRNPPRVEVDGAGMRDPLPAMLPGVGPLWFDDPRARLVQRGGLAIVFAEPVSAQLLGVQLSGEFRYRFVCLRAGVVTAEVELDLRAVPQIAGMVARTVTLPGTVTFDRVHLDTVERAPHEVAALGSLRPE